MMQLGLGPQDGNQLVSAIQQFGVAPGARWMMQAELEGAKQALETGVYVTWRSEKSGQDCVRVGPRHRCFCGHSCACRRFEVVPTRPEEVGAWWLPRRKAFDVRAWRAKCKCGHAHDEHDPNRRSCNLCVGCKTFASDYCCLLCNGSQEEHTLAVETEQARLAAGRPVREAFYPLAEAPALQAQVFAQDNGGGGDGPYVRRRPSSGGGGGRGGALAGGGVGGRGGRRRGRAGGRGAIPAPSLEQSLESLVLSGKITSSEYHERLRQESSLVQNTQQGDLDLKGTGHSRLVMTTNEEKGEMRNGGWMKQRNIHEQALQEQRVMSTHSRNGIRSEGRPATNGLNRADAMKKKSARYQPLSK